MKVKVKSQKFVQPNRTLVLAMIALVLIFGMMFLLAIRPVSASSAFQVATGTVTTTATTGGVAATLAPTIGAGAATLAPTTGAGATLAAPAAGVGTPTALVPVTGADLTQSSDQSRGVLMVAIGLIGLFLIAYGVFSRLGKQTSRDR